MRDRDEAALATPAGALAAALAVWAVAAALGGAGARATGPPPPFVPDVNTAPPRHLLVLPHVGPTRAAAIVAERRRAGPFRSVADLVRVRGIGPRTVAALRGRATAGARSRR